MAASSGRFGSGQTMSTRVRRAALALGGCARVYSLIVPSKTPPAAPQILKRWRAAQKLETYAAAGRKLDVPWFRYRRWEIGECVPLGADMAMLEKKCGVPTDAWAA
jgi:hypothetical protein